MKKPTFKVKNWFKNNSPIFWQIIGDIGLVCSTASGSILILKQELIDIGLTALENNPLFDKINMWALAVGSIIKFITKFIGTKPINTQENDVQETQQS
jgi:hypothetical protein